MYKMYTMYPCHFYPSSPVYNPNLLRQPAYSYDPFHNNFLESPKNHNSIVLKDYGPEPFVINIDEATKQNNTYRTALWTGNHLQLTLMSIKAGGDIGLEMHPDVDQFIRVEEGQGLIKMGDRQDQLDFQRKVYDDFVILIPAGKWHNLINTGNKALKLYSIYAPPNHPKNTIHETKEVAESEESYH